MVDNIQRKMPSREALGAFADALRRLVRTKTFEQICVRDIVRESGLSSRTFYNHFRSKYDLVFWYYAMRDWDTLRTEASGGGGMPTFPELLNDALRRLEADRSLFQGAFADWSGPECLSATLVAHGMCILPEYIRRFRGTSAVAVRQLPLVRFYVEGIVCELARWLSAANPESRDVLAAHLLDAMPAALIRFFSPPKRRKGNDDDRTRASRIEIERGIPPHVRWDARTGATLPSYAPHHRGKSSRGFIRTHSGRVLLSRMSGIEGRTVPSGADAEKRSDNMVPHERRRGRTRHDNLLDSGFRAS